MHEVEVYNENDIKENQWIEIEENKLKFKNIENIEKLNV